jgi:hypothetical protein
MNSTFIFGFDQNDAKKSRNDNSPRTLNFQLSSKDWPKAIVELISALAGLCSERVEPVRG